MSQSLLNEDSKSMIANNKRSSKNIVGIKKFSGNLLNFSNGNHINFLASKLFIAAKRRKSFNPGKNNTYLIFFLASVVTNKFKRFSRLNSALVDQSERSNQDLISNIDVEKSEIEKSRKSHVSKVRRQSTFNNGHIKSNSLLKPSD